MHPDDTSVIAARGLRMTYGTNDVLTGLDLEVTTGELLALLGAYYAPYSTDARPRPYGVDWLLDTVGLTPSADRKIATLSGGQRRRLDVAVGIVGRPELLFLDEPTAGFDPQARRDFHGVVRSLADSEGTTILLTT